MDCGLRLGEVTALKRNDLRDGWLVVDGKTGARQVPVSPGVAAELDTIANGPNFWHRDGAALGFDGVKTVYRRLFHRAGIIGPKLGAHTLRHTFATIYLRAGGGVRQLQSILGHSKLETTLIYVHLAGADVRENHALYWPVRTLSLAEHLWTMSNRSTLSIFVIRTFGPEISVHWMLVILLACITLAMVSCDWLTTNDAFDFVADEGESQPVPTQTRESGSTTLRNLGLLLAGVFALALATWRSVAADRQSKATKEQSATANRSLWNERFQKGIEMLAHDLLSMRLGGIYALHHLGVDSTEHERARIDQSLCAFVRQPPGYVAPGTTMREDIQAITYGFCIRDRSNPQTTKPESTEARRPCR